MADAIVGTGMRDAGYIYVVLDDCWSTLERDTHGQLVADPAKFPSGMKALGDMWCMLAAPLMAGNDLRNMKPEIRFILTDVDAIAIDQDSAGK
jgi:Alpha galactosidase A